MTDEQVQQVLEVIREMEEESGATQEDVLYETLYEEHGLGRAIVTKAIRKLTTNGLVTKPRRAYYSSQR